VKGENLTGEQVAEVEASARRDSSRGVPFPATTCTSCYCCNAASDPHELTGFIGDIQKLTGYRPVLDCGNGLVARWVCPACVARIAPLVRELGVLFRGNQDLHWSSVFKLGEDEKVRRSG
jgi:hypothetical protein